MKKDEELLIKRAQRGNLRAFEELVCLYDAKVLKIIYSMINNIEDSRDIYQEVFIKVFRSIGRFKFQSEFYTWLFRIVINTCITYRKQRTKQQHVFFDETAIENSEHWKIVDAHSIQNPEEQFINTELSHQITASINELSAKQKSVFVLRHYHGYKLKEIAEILKCSEGTVKNYLFRATQRLRNSLKMYHQL